MDDLISWLKVQLDEDERIAKSTAYGSDRESGEWQIDGRYIFDAATGSRVSGDIEDLDHEAAHICHHDPARVQREVAAKRAAVAAYEGTVARWRASQDEFVALARTQPKSDRDRSDLGTYRGRCWLLQGKADGLRAALYAVASGYSDRPGYREEWRPA